MSDVKHIPGSIAAATLRKSRREFLRRSAVTEGDRVRVIIKNDLPESTALHFHGVLLPNNQDGVPFITQPPVKPGESYTYEFTAPNAGSHMYHSHHNSAKQVGLGLLGAFIIEPKANGQYDNLPVD